MGVLETLSMTRRFSKDDYFDTKIVGTTTEHITCSNGLTIVPDEGLDNLEDYDILVVPGGGASKGGGILNLLERRELLNILAAASKRGSLVCSVCTGALLLGKAGILHGRKATTHHDYVDRLSEYAPGVKSVRAKVVVDGNVITGGGISSSIDTGLKIIEETLGGDTADRVAELIEYERRS